MGIWRRPRSLQHKIIAAIVMVGLLPLTVSLVLTYMEQRKAIREAIGANFEQVAVEVARRIEMQVTRGINDAQQLAAIPFIRTAVTEANRSYEGKDPRRIRSMIRDWQRRWRERESQNEFPLFVNSIATSYLMQWHDIRTADYIGILVTDNQGEEAAIVMVGLLPLTVSLVLTYMEQRKAIREAIGANFEQVAVEVARRIEMQVTRGINDAQQLAAIPFIRTAVTEANRSYEGKDPRRIRSMIRDWQRRWRERESQNEFPLFVNSIATSYLMQWHDIRTADYIGILVTDNQGALVLSSIPQVEYDYGSSGWWKSVLSGGRGQIYVGDIYNSFDPSFGTHVLNVSIPITAENQQKAIGAVSVLLRRDTLLNPIAEATVGATGHAMLLRSDGTPLICPILPTLEHTVTSALDSIREQPNGGWVLASDDSHGHENSIVGFVTLRLGQNLAPESLGGHRWVVPSDRSRMACHGARHAATV